MQARCVVFMRPESAQCNLALLNSDTFSGHPFSHLLVLKADSGSIPDTGREDLGHGDNSSDEDALGDDDVADDIEVVSMVRYSHPAWGVEPQYPKYSYTPLHLATALDSR